MRVLGACSLGGSGHLQPLLPLLDAARSLGHETLVVAPGSLADEVARSGHVYARGEVPPDTETASIRAAWAGASPDEVAVLGNRELFGRLATSAMLPAMARVLDDWEPSLVLRDPCEFASAVLAPPRGIRSAQVAIDLAAVEWWSLDIAAPALVAHRPLLPEELRAAPYVTRLPAALDPSPFPDTRRYSVRPQSTGRATARALPDWWNGSRAPLVYMTFGSVLGDMPGAEAAFATLLAVAAGMSGVRVLLTVGRRFDPGRLGAIPPHVHLETWVDQELALRDAEVVVCHGGSGTTFGALAAGVPLVVVPLFVGGQFSNGARVEQAGVGLAVTVDGDGDGDGDGGRGAIGLSDAPRIREAVDRVRGEPSFRERAQLIAAEMADAPWPEGILADLLA